LLSDSKGELVKNTEIAFQGLENLRSILIKEWDGAKSTFIMIRSVFIVNLAGKINFEYITFDYKYWISNELVVAAAKSLNKE
jgi:hypothetical protein